jgi:allantoinase
LPRAGGALDLVVTGGTVVAPTGRVVADVGVASGRIAAIAEPATLRGAEEVDARGLWVLPGAVDAHFHVRAPAHPHREDWTSATCAAAAGGITTLLEMPISSPAAYTGAVVRARRELGERQAVVDFGLFAAPGTLERRDITSSVEEGAVAFKVFLHAAPPERLDEFTGICVTDSRTLYEAFRLVGTTGLGITAHCEDQGVLDAVGAAYRGDVGPSAHPRLRPVEAEVVAVAQALAMSEATGTPVHVAHITSAAAVALVHSARRRGVRATMETCPHYLEFTAAAMEQHGPFAKVNPPLRGDNDRAALWHAVLDGSITLVASDHAPFTASEKAVGWTDIRPAPSGTPGVEMLLPYMMDRALRGTLTVEHAVALLSERPARLYGLAPRKGALAPGADADFVLFDPSGTWTVDRARLRTKARECAALWDGFVFAGRIHATYVRGRAVYQDGAVTGAPGWGRFVRPGRTAAVPV